MGQPLYTAIVVMNLPVPVDELILRVGGILDGVEANPTVFPSPSPSIAEARQHLADLLRAEANLSSGLGTATSRNIPRKLVIEDTRRIHAYVQERVSADPEHAVTIASLATMTIKQSPRRQKATLEVRRVVEGVAKLIAKVVTGARAYMWQVSYDGKVSWIDAGETTKASTTLEGLKVATTIWVRFRVLKRKEGLSDWSDAVSYLVT